MDANVIAVKDPTRGMVFVSHANPEDNEFSQWLALRLAREGYRVWCDLTKLLGGDDFWQDIDEALRTHTAKFVYVLSKTSNIKEGPLRELFLANSIRKKQELKDFVVPIKIDDLPFSDHNIELIRLNAISFCPSWAEGFQALLRTFEEDGVPKDSRYGPAAVAAWWNDNRLNRQIVEPRPEPYYSNLFPLTDIPDELWVWKVLGNSPPRGNGLWPAYRIADRYVSFADGKSLSADGASSPTGASGFRFSTSDLLTDPPREVGLSQLQIRTAIRQLLLYGWERATAKQDVLTHELSGKRKTLYLPLGFTPNDEAVFKGATGKRSRRGLVGYATKSKVDGSKYKRYWHYGLEARPTLYPTYAMALKAHVVFTLDGKTITGTAADQHRARRSQCKNWWNDDWRDRLLATTQFLAAGQEAILLPLAPNTNARMAVTPMIFSSPVSYGDESVQKPSDELLGSDRDDVDADDADNESGAAVT